MAWEQNVILVAVSNLFWCCLWCFSFAVSLRASWTHSIRGKTESPTSGKTGDPGNQREHSIQATFSWNISPWENCKHQAFRNDRAIGKARFNPILSLHYLYNLHGKNVHQKLLPSFDDWINIVHCLARWASDMITYWRRQHVFYFLWWYSTHTIYYHNTPGFVSFFPSQLSGGQITRSVWVTSYLWRHLRQRDQARVAPTRAGGGTGGFKARSHMRFLRRFLVRFCIQNAPYLTLHDFFFAKHRLEWKESHLKTPLFPISANLAVFCRSITRLKTRAG